MDTNHFPDDHIDRALDAHGVQDHGARQFVRDIANRYRLERDDEQSVMEFVLQQEWKRFGEISAVIRERVQRTLEALHDGADDMEGGGLKLAA